MKVVTYQSPEWKRRRAEESYHRRHEINFQFPFQLADIPSDPCAILSSQVGVRKLDYTYRWTTLDQLQPDDDQFFCLKDVALYLNAPPPPPIFSGTSIFSTIYRHFFPHRNLDLDLERTHFFGTPISVANGRTVSELSRFHDALCRKVDALASTSKQGNSRLPECYGLTETFRDVLLIIEADSAHPPVLLVCRDEETASRLHLDDAHRESSARAGSAGKVDQDPAAAWPLCYRMDLAQAMNAIFSVDESRRAGVEPDSVWWRQEITDQEEYIFCDISEVDELAEAKNSGQGDD